MIPSLCYTPSLNLPEERRRLLALADSTALPATSRAMGKQTSLQAKLRNQPRFRGAVSRYILKVTLARVTGLCHRLFRVVACTRWYPDDDHKRTLSFQASGRIDSPRCLLIPRSHMPQSRESDWFGVRRFLVDDRNRPYSISSLTLVFSSP